MNNILSILSRLGIEQLNAMQQDAMLAYRKSKAMVLLSPTGSGKTLAYLLPMFETIKEEGVLQAIIIVPSRELAIQTVNVIKDSGTSVRAVAVYGGRPAMDEHRTLCGVHPHVIVGTPGRLLDHLRKGNIQPDTLHTLIIDEFDKCLELGFRDEMSQVFSALPNNVKRVLLSATENTEITNFLPEYTRLDYLDHNAQSERIEQYVVKSPQKDKLETLSHFLHTLGQEQTIVFVGFRESVERVAKFLHQHGFYVSSLHGGMEQRDREKELYRFVSGCTNILVSTDIASRGLDIQDLDNVVHYHLPLNEQAFIHRNGRTARWDNVGRSFLLIGPDEDVPEYVGITNDFYILDNSPIVIQPPKWETLYIGKGKKDKLSKGDIAGFLMKVGGFERDEVGRIDVRDHYSYVAVSRDRLPNALPYLKEQKIKGMKTIIERIR